MLGGGIRDCFPEFAGCRHFLQGQEMTEWVLYFWVLTGTAQITPVVEVGTFYKHENCKVAAESLTAKNPEDKWTNYAVIAKCVRREK